MGGKLLKPRRSSKVFIVGNLGVKRWVSLTPLRINIEPKNGGLEDDFPFPLGGF